MDPSQPRPDVHAPAHSAEVTGQSGPPPGFGKDVNDYLNHFVTVADAKATAFLAATLVVASVALTGSPPNQPLLRTASFVGVILLAASGVLSVVAIFPRLPKASRGLVFWEHIRQHKSASEYLNAARGLDPTAVEEEFATQNYYISAVLHRKHAWLRMSIPLFILGSLLIAVPIVWGITCLPGPNPTISP